MLWRTDIKEQACTLFLLFIGPEMSYQHKFNDEVLYVCISTEYYVGLMWWVLILEDSECAPSTVIYYSDMKVMHWNELPPATDSQQVI